MRFLLCLLLATNCLAKSKVQIDLEIIRKIESNGDQYAFNPGFNKNSTDDDSYGLYQITPVCLKAYNQANKTNLSLIRLWNPDVNRAIARWMFEKEIPRLLTYFKLEHTVENYLICYNAGIKYAIDKKKRNKISLDYVDKYYKFLLLKYHLI